MIYKSLKIGYRLFIKSTKSEYSNMAFGYFWNFAEPITLTVIFAILRSGNIIKASVNDYPFFLYLLTGLFPFQLFFTHIQRTTNSIEANSNLLNQINLSPLSIVFTNYFHWLFDSLFVALVISLSCLIFSPNNIFYLPIAFILLQLFGLLAIGIGLIAAPINTVYKDTSKIISLTLRPLMFASPIFYLSYDSPLLNKFNQFNPIAIFLTNYRAMTLDINLFNWKIFLLFLTICGASILGGIWFFSKALPCLNTKS
jgi:ABC-type polysaccharide/polyol phosphate export permease